MPVPHDDMRLLERTPIVSEALVSPDRLHLFETLVGSWSPVQLREEVHALPSTDSQSVPPGWVYFRG